MISKYFKAVPTLIVLGVTGYTTSPILFGEADPAPSKEIDQTNVRDKPGHRR